jgi:glyoxylase-like metal-dependent hydrolase (beta-lactamase superfamily II)
VVHVVCHWDHAGAVQAVAEASGADLTVLVHEQLFGYIPFGKDFGIFPEYSLK